MCAILHVPSSSSVKDVGNIILRQVLQDVDNAERSDLSDFIFKVYVKNMTAYINGVSILLTLYDDISLLNMYRITARMLPQ